MEPTNPRQTERFVTLTEGDARLKTLLQGDVVRDGVIDADVRPLLLGTPSGEAKRDWTFEFVSLTNLAKPSFVTVWLKALRPDSWVLSVAPILAVMGMLGRDLLTSGIQRAYAVLSIVGILALHASINLFNDYHDYVRGWDRVHERGGSRVISRGWLRAKDVRLAAWCAFGIAMLAGMPVISANFSPGILLALFALAAALEFAVSRFGLKYRGFAEITAWFMFGPLLTGGFAWAMTGRWLWASFAVGAVFGSLALLCLHLKNFERILVDGRAGQKTWPVRAGFDASKTFTYFCLVLIGASLAFVLVFADPVVERVLPLIVFAFGAGPLAMRVHGLESPLAGRMRGLHAAGLQLAWFNMLAFLLGDLLRVFDGFVGYLP